jgi:hypothetical protein
MSGRDEAWLLDHMDQLLQLVFENNCMLIDLCHVVSIHLANHDKENEEDFGRNVLANIISSTMGFNRP